MAVHLTSIETMRPGYRPDDECVDFMARSVAEATGSTMPGQPGKQERQDCAVSDTIVTYQELAGSFRAMGPLHTGEFRSAVRPPTSRQKKRKAAEFDPDPAILEVRDGPAESCEDALIMIRLHSLVMGRASGMVRSPRSCSSFQLMRSTRRWWSFSPLCSELSKRRIQHCGRGLPLQTTGASAYTTP
jgi:hypothetical protein